MSPISDVIETAIRETMTARTLVSKIKVKQVTGIDAIAVAEGNGPRLV